MFGYWIDYLKATVLGVSFARDHVKGKTIWITGASSGIGEELAVRCSELGARVVLSGRSLPNLERVKAKCVNPGSHVIVDFDVVDDAASKQAVDRVITAVGRVDWLINNAGISHRSTILETTMECERHVMEVDFFAQTRLTRLILPYMIKAGGGKIVMVSSIAGLLGTQGRSAYGASKAALHMWANSLRAELSDRGITVATLFPGFVQTNVSTRALKGDGTPHNSREDCKVFRMSARDFAVESMVPLMRGDEYVVRGGLKEWLGTIMIRLSPQLLYRQIRKTVVH